MFIAENIIAILCIYRLLDSLNNIIKGLTGKQNVLSTIPTNDNIFYRPKP